MDGSSSSPGAITLGDVVRAALPTFSKNHRLPAHHWSVLRAIVACRTPTLGGHLYRCESCGKDHFVPHSCRNRHCPTCQGSNGADWLEKQTEHLLPIPYFHIVFTLPHELNLLIQHNHYGLVANRDRDTRIAKARELLKAHPEMQISSSAAISKEVTPTRETELRCPHCGEAKLVLIRVTLPSPTAQVPAVIDTS